jgi:hypothetical protein
MKADITRSWPTSAEGGHAFGDLATLGVSSSILRPSSSEKPKMAKGLGPAFSKVAKPDLRRSRLAMLAGLGAGKSVVLYMVDRHDNRAAL